MPWSVRSWISKPVSFHIIHSPVNYQGPVGTYPPGYIMREPALENVPAQYLQQGCNGILGALLDYAKSVGHVGGADVFISLEQLVHIGELAADDNVLLVSRRTGWICTASVVTILDLPPWSV